ncbi:MAG: EamA family transporter [Sphingomonadales bacterium]|nr:EamA family transporter [Sphingomonadales bacterium]
MTRRSVVLPLLAILAAMACFQMGAAAAKQLYPAIGPIGAASVRLLFGAAILLALVRPWRHWPANPPLLGLFGLGICMAATLLFFYLAIDHLPLAVAITIQIMGPIVGPLLLAIVTSTRAADLLWVALAAGGLLCLLGAAPSDMPVNTIGLIYALIAAAGWAGYIVFGRMAGNAFGHGTAALSVAVAALAILPVGLAKVGAAMFAPALLPWALLVALLSAAIPFSLELFAMPRLPARTFAVLMSLEPAFAVLSGFAFLGEHLRLVQILGILLVIAASAGTVWSHSRAGQPA